MVRRFEGLIKAIVEHPQMDTQTKVGAPLGRALLCGATVDLLCNKTKEVVDLIKAGDFDRVRTTFAEFRDLVRIALAAECNIECPVPKEPFVRKVLVK
jgi:hypothetical protein